MYPQFWTTGIGGILMKYSYEYKKKCVALYREGKWAETPEGVSQKRFHDNIREWVRVEEAKGPEGLQHKNQNKVWTAEEKYAPITKVLAGASVTSTAISEGIRPGLLHQFEDSVLLPLAESGVYALLASVAFRQLAPLTSGSQYPHYAIQHGAVIFPRSSFLTASLRGQVVFDPIPLACC